MLPGLRLLFVLCVIVRVSFISVLCAIDCVMVHGVFVCVCVCVLLCTCVAFSVCVCGLLVSHCVLSSDARFCFAVLCVC